jgi:GAF domain-containing protein
LFLQCRMHPNFEPFRDAVLAKAQARGEALMAQGAALRDALAPLAQAIEAVSGGLSAASILVIDPEGLLRDGSSPSLPQDYLEKIDKLRPHPNVGTCAAAAATGREVFTPDLQNDDKWAELRHFPLALGFRAAWSMPLKDHRGTVLGTFGSYFREARKPTEQEIAAVRLLAPLAARIIETHRKVR